MAKVKFCKSVFVLLFLIKSINCSSPNIILILADDLGYGDLAASGHPTSLSPNLDKLASSSLDLKSFYTASSVCSPSRAAILTGKYPVTAGIWPGVFMPESLGGLDPSHLTLASRLSKFGYRTGHIGKWHLGVGEHQKYLPTRHGFQQYLGIPYSHDMCPCLKCFEGNVTAENQSSCYDHCRVDQVGCPLFFNEKIIEQPTDLTKLTEKYTQAALKFVKNSVRKQQKPFFLYMAYHQTHHPQFASSKWSFKTKRVRFGDALAEMDDSIGQILNSVSNLGISNNTLILFTSDNGPSLARHERGGCAGPLRCGKGTTWEGGIRVPALINWKGVIEPRKSTELFSALDIMPTFMSIIGHPIKNMESEGVHGIDQSKMIFLGQGQRTSLAHFSESPQKDIGIMALRWQNYKAHFYTQGNSLSDDKNYDQECTSHATLTKRNPPLLYDLNTDPGERYPLDPDIYANILQKMADLKQNLTEKIPWGPSEMKKGTSQNVSPCCASPKKSCTPFPICCNCPSDNSIHRNIDITINDF